MPSSAVLSSFVVAAFVIMAVPGPSVLYAVTRTVEHGRAAGLWSVLGLETGLLVHVLAAAVGVSALVASSEAALTGLRLGGAAFLAYLGVRSWLQRGPGRTGRGRHRPSRVAQPEPAGDPLPTAGPASSGPASRARLFRDGVLIDLLNPKTCVFFLAFLPQFVDPGRGPAGVQVLVLGAVVVGLACLCDGTYALVAGRLAHRLRTTRVRGRLSAFAGVVYLGLAGLALAT